ncbi:unnamed protein product [Closterium sp. Yama58-4]|nr:unnamed protein product [Closterium sp. Yama58-4]
MEGREGAEGLGIGAGNMSAAAGGFSQDFAGSESHRAEAEPVWKERQKQVVAAFRHAWKGYRTYAFGSDELMPLSRGGEDGLGRLGATIVDGLDTAMIMGIKDIVDEAGQWIVNTLPEKINHAGQVNFFETTIRVLGGLLSAYHLKKDPGWRGKGGLERGGGGGGVAGMQGGERGGARGGEGGELQEDVGGPAAEKYLEVAVDLGDRLMLALTQSPTPVPLSDVYLAGRYAQRANGGGLSSTAECTTVQLEFWELSRLTGEQKYGAAAMQVMEHVWGLQRLDGLVPIYME